MAIFRVQTITVFSKMKEDEFYEIVFKPMQKTAWYKLLDHVKKNNMYCSKYILKGSGLKKNVLTICENRFELNIKLWIYISIQVSIHIYAFNVEIMS